MLTAAQVRAARAMIEMKQQELAEAAGVTRSVLAAFEAGQSASRSSTLGRIRRVLEARGVVFIESEAGAGVLLRSDI
jgi:predicted transcriptional regulator